MQRPADPLEVIDRLGEERLALEAGEARIVLEEDHARVAQHHGGGLHPGHGSRRSRVMGARIVLHFLTRPEQIVPRRRRRGMTDAVATAKRGQRRIRDARRRVR